MKEIGTEGQHESHNCHLLPGVANDREILAGKGSRGLLMECCGRLGLEAERIAQEIELAHGNRRRKRQGDASTWEVVFNHHLRHQGDAHAGRQPSEQSWRAGRL